ncbi:hypothetical protein BGX26_009215 [Mortierella sp. AD094]|nr:hypothetical protein BGX26_009215 [Mortierella sp. AD094]
MPDFLKLANKTPDKTVLPVSRIPRLVVKRASGSDENPFLVTPSSPTSAAALEILPTSTTAAEARDNSHASYLDTVYIVDDTPLGTGEYSQVLRVRDRKSNELYAVKMLKKSVQGAMERKRYLSEARNMWKIERSHPNIVQLLSAWEQGGKIYMRMELCRFGSLDRILKRQKPRGGLDEGCIWQCLKDISAGLQAIHNSNIVHLDLKPENICISSTGSLKIGDFGHSVILPVRETDGIEGDRRYMAPELLNGQCGKYSDIFSLGISMYEIQSNRCGEIPGGGPEWHQLRNGMFGVVREETVAIELEKKGGVSDPGYLEPTSEVHSSLCQPTKSELLDLIKAMMQTAYESRPLVEEVSLMASKRTSVNITGPLGSGGRGALYELVYGPELAHSIHN